MTNQTDPPLDGLVNLDRYPIGTEPGVGLSESAKLTFYDRNAS